MNSGIAFIASHLNIAGDLPTEILPGHILRRARETEIALIREYLGQLSPRAHVQWVNYESVVKEERYEGRTNLHFDHLPSEQWKYWVIAFEGSNQLIHEIETIGCLLPVDFDFAFQVYFSLPDQQGERMGWSLAPMHIIEKYTSHEQIFRNAQELTTDQIAGIAQQLKLYRDASGSHAFVSNALQTYTALRRVPASYGLYVVGLFSIIESLITHAPRLTETLDSINHQITNKIILLRKRYSSSIIPNSYFLHAGEESVWKKLYSYRSGVAHGSTITFDGDLQILKGHTEVVRFLRDNVRELIALGLREPEFLNDLRKC